MRYSDVYTLPPNIPARAWALRSASGLSNAQAGESGWNLSAGEVRRFSLQSRLENPSKLASGQKPISILLAEDNPADVGLVREALEEYGVEGELIVATDGEKAIQFIHDIDAQQVTCPDLFVVDLNLPKKPGREVLESIRLSVHCLQTPVVILTSSDAQRDRDDAMRLGASKYLRKPSHLEEFIQLGAIFKAMLCAIQ